MAFSRKEKIDLTRDRIRIHWTLQRQTGTHKDEMEPLLHSQCFQTFKFNGVFGWPAGEAGNLHHGKLEKLKEIRWELEVLQACH